MPTTRNSGPEGEKTGEKERPPVIRKAISFSSGNTKGVLLFEKVGEEEEGTPRVSAPKPVLSYFDKKKRGKRSGGQETHEETGSVASVERRKVFGLPEERKIRQEGIPRGGEG